MPFSQKQKYPLLLKIRRGAKTKIKNKKMKNHSLVANNFFIGWKINNIKKAVDHKLSHRGLIISMSIAFFVVLICAQLLSYTYKSLIAKDESNNAAEQITMQY
ncbi:MAG: hypothetical protein PHT51_00065 [Patescibacteria group bacterium]|nr:hypothetical protein [Patescibacteria group bacterium]